MNIKHKALCVLLFTTHTLALTGCSTEDQKWFSSLASEAASYASALAGGQRAETATLNMAANVVSNSMANSDSDAASTPTSSVISSDTSSISPASLNSITAQNVSISSEIAAVDLSGNCDEAQAKGVAWANKIAEIAQARGPAICQSAKDAEKAGEIMVRVARACKVIPNWQEEEAAGIKLINEARETQRGSCVY